MSNARFSIVPAWIVTDPRLKGSDLKVLCLLGSFTNKEGWCRRSQVKMANELACGRSTVQASLTRLCEIGVVERRQVDSSDGRSSAHWYRVIHDRSLADSVMAAWQEAAEDEEKDPNENVGELHPPATIVAPPALPTGHPLPGPSGWHMNDTPLTNSPNDGERARVPEVLSEEDNPKTLEARFRKWWACWPTYQADDEFGTRRAWLALTPEQRLECERLTPAYLDTVQKKIGRSKIQKAATYLRQRPWERLDAASIASGQAAPVAKIPVAPFGPIWAGLRALNLLKGGQSVELPLDLRERIEQTFDTLRKANEGRAMAYLAGKGISFSDRDELIFPADFDHAEWKRRKRTEGFPEVNRLHQRAVQRERDVADARFAALSELCEPVPVGSELYGRWRDHDDAAGWPFVPDAGSMPVVYFPKGGPDGLAAFELATKALISRERGDEHAA